MKYGFGIDLGGTTVKIAYFNETGKLLDKWEIPTDISENGAHILPDIAASVKEYCQTKGIPNESLIGAGIDVPGPVNGRGIVSRCVNLGWENVDVNKEFSALLGLPVRSANDANAAALGEYWMGGGKNYDSIVMVTLGTGVGGGIVLNGNLIHGVHGTAGEVGHMVLNRDETDTCGCGKHGCVEQYCSANGIVRMAKRYLAENDTASVLRGTDFNCRDIFVAADSGDPAAKAVIDQFYRYLGEFLADLCTVLDPDVVVIGGGVSKAGRVLIDGMRPWFRKYCFPTAADTEFELASLGNDAGAYGAFKLILDSVQ